MLFLIIFLLHLAYGTDKFAIEVDIVKGNNGEYYPKPDKYYLNKEAALEMAEILIKTSLFIDYNQMEEGKAEWQKIVEDNLRPLHKSFKEGSVKNVDMDTVEKILKNSAFSTWKTFYDELEKLGGENYCALGSFAKLKENLNIEILGIKDKVPAQKHDTETNEHQAHEEIINIAKNWINSTEQIFKKFYAAKIDSILEEYKQSTGTVLMFKNAVKGKAKQLLTAAGSSNSPSEQKKKAEQIALDKCRPIAKEMLRRMYVKMWRHALSYVIYALDIMPPYDFKGKKEILHAHIKEMGNRGYFMAKLLEAMLAQVTDEKDGKFEVKIEATVVFKGSKYSNEKKSRQQIKQILAGANAAGGMSSIGNNVAENGMDSASAFVLGTIFAEQFADLADANMDDGDGDNDNNGDGK